ncbi:hypothetical protein DFH09DRAFT_1438025 [Mycena vulgaris]|nr:hypothetical protein DFH09DRAFT_1438025 [Mycena vulgaris]
MECDTSETSKRRQCPIWKVPSEHVLLIAVIDPAHASSSSNPTPTPDGTHPFFHFTRPSLETFSASYPVLARQMSTHQRAQGYVPGASAGPTFGPDPTARIGARGCYVLTPLGRAGLAHGRRVLAPRADAYGGDAPAVPAHRERQHGAEPRDVRVIVGEGGREDGPQIVVRRRDAAHPEAACDERHARSGRGRERARLHGGMQADG